MLEKRSLGDVVFTVLNHVFLIGFAVFCLLPFWIMIVASFTDDYVLRKDGYLPWAEKWSLEAYRWVLAGQDIQVGYRVSVFVTLVGTLALFTAVMYWNDWFLGVMLLDFADFRPLSVIILRMIRNIRAILEAINQPGVASVPVESIPTHSVRMATAAVTIGPILLVYPFVQQYFIKGLTLGAVKG
jgi:ABC-type glycerol-3-phosphate transport system permease component